MKMSWMCIVARVGNGRQEEVKVGFDAARWDTLNYIDYADVEDDDDAKVKKGCGKGRWAHDMEAMMHVMYGAQGSLHAFLFLFSDKRYNSQVVVTVGRSKWMEREGRN